MKPSGGKSKMKRAAVYLRRAVRLSKQTILLKWQRITRYRPVQAVLNYFSAFAKADIIGMAAGTAYYMLFALFPLMILLLYILAVFSTRVDISVFIEHLATMLPNNLITLTAAVTGELKNFLRQEVALLSFLVLIFTASKGFGALLGNLYEIYGKKRINSNFLLARIVGLLTTLLMGVLMILIMFILIFGQTLMKWLRQILNLPWFWEIKLLNYIGDLVSLLILGMVFGVALYISSGRIGRFRYALLVGCLMSLAWVLISLVFSNYLSKAERYHFLYGGLSSVMLLLFWVFVIMVVIFGGALIHATVLRAQGLLPEAPADAEASSV